MPKRTLVQNASLHLYFRLLAEELNNAGLDMKKTLKQDADIPWSDDRIKEFLWKPIQDAQLGKKSTTELTTSEVDKVYETLNRHLGEKLKIVVTYTINEPDLY